VRKLPSTDGEGSVGDKTGLFVQEVGLEGAALGGRTGKLMDNLLSLRGLSITDLLRECAIFVGDADICGDSNDTLAEGLPGK
jgi:hypothetical protein